MFRLVSRVNGTHLSCSRRKILNPYRPYAVSSELCGRISSDYTVRSPLPKSVIPEENLAEFLLGNFQFVERQTALVNGINGQRVFYAQLYESTSRLSSALRNMGLQKGEVVAVCSPNSMEYPSVFLGTLAAGGTISTCNPAYSPNELSYQFKNSNAKYVFTTPSYLKNVEKAIEGTDVDKIIVTEKGSSPDSNLVSIDRLYEDSGSAFKMESVNSKEDIAILPYSSGTTGLPKGVMLTHYSVTANCCQLDHPDVLGLTNGETIMSILPFFHIYGMVVIMFSGIRKGAKQVILPKFEPNTFLAAIQNHRIESASVVPPLVLFLSKDENVAKYDLSSLRSLMSGAAPLGREVIQTACRRTGVNIIRQTYGLTETSPVTHVMPLRIGKEKERSIGLPLPNIACRIVDTNSGVPLGPNEEGEIIIDGPNVMKGYLNKPEETAKCIDENGHFHTGDIGFYDKEGHFYITDRLKELIKVKGFQVAPAELEALLLHHPEILDAAVLGVDNEQLGEAPKAFVVRKSSSLGEGDVQKFVEENISKHKWLVGGVEFIDQIPKSASGKILRRQLRA